MGTEHCFSEKNIIEKAIRHINSNVATDEERLLIKLYKCDTMESVLDKIHDEIQLPNESDKNIKKAFFRYGNCFE